MRMGSFSNKEKLKMSGSLHCLPFVTYLCKQKSKTIIHYIVFNYLEIIRYLVWGGRKLKTKVEMNLQTRTHKSHGRTIVAGYRLQENLMKSVSCRLCHVEVTLLENVSASSRLGSSWICENKHCPSRNSSENLLTNLVARAAEFRSCKGYFPPGATFEPAL